MKVIISVLKSKRLWGLLGTAVALWFLLFVVFGKADVSWIMPPTDKIAAAIIDVWPKMPFFAQKEQTVDGQTEIRYTVPTHQLSRAELERLGLTNTATHPAAPK